MLLTGCRECLFSNSLASDQLTQSIWQPETKPYEFEASDLVIPFDRRPAQAVVRDWTKFIQQYVAKERKRGNSKEAVQISERLRALENAPLLTDGVQLNAVGVYGGVRGKRRSDPQTGTIHLTANNGGRGIILLLCAYESMKWNVQVSPGVDLKRVILAGHGTHSVEGLNAEVKIEGNLTSAPNDRYRFYATDKAGEWASALPGIRTLTGLQPATILGSHRIEAAPLTIGPENPDWTNQLRRSLLQPLFQQVLARQLKQSPQLTSPIFPVAHFAGKDARSSFSTSSVFGPFAEFMQPLEVSVNQIVHDPELGFYGISDDTISKIDPNTGEVEPMEIKELGKVNSGARLALAPSTHDLFIHEHDFFVVNLKDHSVRILNEKGLPVIALAWSPHHKCLFGLCATYDGNSFSSQSEIRAYNTRGAEIGRVKLHAAITNRIEGGSQLIAIGENLMILHTATHKNPVNYMINPKTGQTVFACTRRPRTTATNNRR